MRAAPMRPREYSPMNLRPLRLHPAMIWLQAMIVLVLCAQAFRWTLWIASAGLPIGTKDAYAGLMMSLRFDCMAAAYACTPLLIGVVIMPFLKTESARGRVSAYARRYALAATGVISLIGIVNFGFFQEYRDQFNPWVFGAIDDDAGAVAKTFFKTFHWGRYLMATLLILAVLALIFRRSKKPTEIAPTTTRTQILLIVLVAVLAIGAYRGGYNRRPASMKDAYVCADETANRLIPNPTYLIRTLIQSRLKAADASTPPDFVGEIRIHAQALADDGVLANDQSINDLIKHRVSRDKPEPLPKQVFLIVMESYDKWPMTPPYEALGLSTELSALARAGAVPAYFVSGDSGTMVSLAPIITGLPSCDLPQNYQERSAREYPTGVATLFKKLGYKTRLAYGGYGGWQRIADFARQQGFDEVITGANIPCPDEHRGEWGVPDGFLFDYLYSLERKDAVPTFTLVMSTSYHPPYEHKLEKLDPDALVTMPASLAQEWNGEHSERVLAHLRYSDRALGKFVRETVKLDPDAVFAITGDHWSRKFLNNRPSLSQRKEVPFVLYAPERIPAGTELAPGAHLDIVPTLLHLIAPNQFEFPAFGVDLVAAKTNRAHIGYGNLTFVGPQGLIGSEPGADAFGTPPTGPELETARRRAEAQKALSWWLLLRGETLPEKQK